MMRISTILLSLMLVAGCNFKDDVTFPGADNNDDNNPNNMADMTVEPDADGDDMSTTPFTVDITDVQVNGSALPTSAPSQTPFEVTGNVLAENSADCPGCKVQIVVGITDAGPPGCLMDQVPTGSAYAGTVTIDGPSTTGMRDLLWAGYQEADCAAAIARAMAEAPTSNSLGTINFTAPPSLAVVAVSPADAARSIPVDATIRVTFDGPIDAASVTGRVRLSEGGVQVPTTISVMGNDIILTPSAPLNELQTVHTVLVSSGVTSGGRTLESDFSSSFATRMFVPNVFYSASNEFHGVGVALGIDSANQCVMMPADITAPAQRFRFVPRDVEGWIGYNSAPVAATRALDGGDGVSNCAMTPLAATPLPSQVWNFTRQPAGAFVVQNQRFGMAQSLDGTNSPPAPAANLACQPGTTACPVMQPTTAINRQFWRWTRLP